MRSNKGITLVTLIIIIIIMLIISGTAIYAGAQTLEESKIVSFIDQMKIAESYVDSIAKKVKRNESATYKNLDGTEIVYLYSGRGINTGLEEYYAIQEAIADVNEICERTGEEIKQASTYRYFTKEDLKEIGIEGVELTLLIDIEAKEIISVKPVKRDGIKYYRLKDLGESNDVVEAEIINTVDFEIEKKNYGLRTEIAINNIEYSENANNATISYAKLTGTEIDYWRTAQNSSFEITESGNYRIRVLDSLGNETTEDINVTLCNPPALSEEMKPVIWEGTNWKVVDETDGTWYDYAEQVSDTDSGGTSRWANVMLEDGLEYNIVTGIVSSPGSMFVWIPRYMYNITGVQEEIDISFLQETSNIPTDKSNTYIENIIGTNKWIVHPAFTDNVENGGWDSELTGFWVAKYESSMEISSNTGATWGTLVPGDASSGNVATTNATNSQYDQNQVRCVSKPGINSWRYISTANSYNNAYNYNREFESHLMKNSEWGATIYLAQSKFGRNRTQITNNSTYVSASGGPLTTTTGNEYRNI